MRVFTQTLKLAAALMFVLVPVLLLRGADKTTVVAQNNYPKIAGTPHDFGENGCLTCHSEARMPADGANKDTLCLGCHENAASRMRTRTGLKSHPSNVAYNVRMLDNLRAPQWVQAAGLPLDPLAPMVNCVTCHDPHDNTKGRFMRVQNTNGTRLCETCHDSDKLR